MVIDLLIKKEIFKSKYLKEIQEVTDEYINNYAFEILNQDCILKLLPNDLEHILNLEKIIVNETELLHCLLLYIKEKGPNKKISKRVVLLNYKSINLSELSEEEKKQLYAIIPENDIKGNSNRTKLPILNGIDEDLKNVIYKLYPRNFIKLECIIYI